MSIAFLYGCNDSCNPSQVYVILLNFLLLYNLFHLLNAQRIIPSVRCPNSFLYETWIDEAPFLLHAAEIEVRIMDTLIRMNHCFWMEVFI